MRILVAEDERDMNRLITRTLEKEGYGVDSCHDGDEALNYLDSADYDAAILDIMMPRRDGYEVLKHLRGLGKETPVLFLTARDIELSSREYAILEYMALNQGRVLSREQIEDHVWNFDYSGGTNVVDVYISYLRKKLTAVRKRNSSARYGERAGC